MIQELLRLYLLNVEMDRVLSGYNNTYQLKRSTLLICTQLSNSRGPTITLRIVPWILLCMVVLEKRWFQKLKMNTKGATVICVVDSSVRKH